MPERKTSLFRRAPLALLPAGLVAVFATPGEGQVRPFTAEDMLAVVRISGDVAVSPAGDQLAYVLPDLDDAWNVGERLQRGTVHLQSIVGTEIERPVPVGPEGQWSSFPVFSPDGSSLAFYVEDTDGGQLAVREISTGRIQFVGEPFSGKAWTVPAWASRDRIVYTRPAAEPIPEATPRIQVLHSTDESLPGDAYFRPVRRSGLAVVDLRSGSELALLGETEPLRSFDVAPDGDHVLASVTGGGGPAEAMLFPLDGGDAPRRIGSLDERVAWMPDGRLFWMRGGRLLARSTDTSANEVLADVGEGGGVIWAADGTRFASLLADRSITDPEIEPPQPGMYTIARAFTDLYLGSVGGEGSVNLTPHITDRVGSPVWSDDGSSLFFVATDNASYDETLYRYDVPNGTLSVLARGGESYGALTPLPGGLLVSKQSATAPPDLWRVDTDSGAWTRVTELNPGLSNVSFSKPELFHFDNADGDRLGALLYKPSGADDTQGVPVVTYVYEKLTPGIHRFAPRQQIFATHGYAVLMPNVKVKVGETATSFVKAVVPAVEAVRGMGFTNDRFCLWGGSFGAYAVSYVITQTNVFQCAVSRATPPELFRNWASGRDRDSDNIERGQARMGGSPFEVMERYLSQSAFFHLDQVETPVLLMHGVKDYTILFEEGGMMFYALRRLGKKATFVAYSEGDHSLYRHSREDALDVHRRMLDWFDEYLMPEGGRQ